MDDREMNITKADSKEEYLNILQARMIARGKQIEMLQERMDNMQKANARDLLKMEETRLLKDIRDGRVTLIHAETGKPLTTRFFSI